VGSGDRPDNRRGGARGAGGPEASGDNNPEQV